MKYIYFVGIKGVAMTALAIYCKQSSMTVSGCDTGEEFPTDTELKKAGIQIDIGFNPEKLPKKTDTVIYTGAHGGRDNPVVVRAMELGIQTFPHGKALGMMMEGKRQIVAAGSHGKTTISAMLATILKTAQKDPSYAVGCGGITGIGAPGHYGKSDWFVAEGDEYITDPGHDSTPRFLWMHPEILVVSNIDYDHPDAYPNLEVVKQAFEQLQEQQIGQKITIVNIDDHESHILLSGEQVVTCGFSPRADLRITHMSVGNERMFFALSLRGMSVGEFMLHIPGKHNVANAAAAAFACHAAGLTWEEIRDGLNKFRGTKRRFEKIGEAHGVMFYDDYAHHPKEIVATLAAARSWYPDDHIIAVFQPHTYSRTKALLTEFGKAFTGADTVIITDIYASAREHDTLGISGRTLFDEIRKNHKDVIFAPKPADVTRVLVRDGIVLFMGAGDIYMWEKDVMQ